MDVTAVQTMVVLAGFSDPPEEIMTLGASWFDFEASIRVWQANADLWAETLRGRLPIP